MYTGVRHSWGETFTSRWDLVGYFHRIGMVEQAWKLTRCGVTPKVLTRGKSKRRRVLGCHAGYCPICARLRRNRIFSGMRPWIEGQMGELGAAAHVKVALPHSEGRILERMERLAKKIRSATAARDWRKRFSGQVGVVMNLEIGPGTSMTGHPHAHLFIYARTEEGLDAFLGWLKAWWRRRAKRDLIEGAGLTYLGRDPGTWAPRLRYVLKGNRINPGWPVGLVKEVMEAITSGRRYFSVWGIAARRGGWTRARRAANIQALRPFSGSALRATG